MFCTFNERLGSFISQIAVYPPMANVNEGRDDDGYDELVAIVEEGNGHDVRERQLPGKGYRKHNECVEELRAERGACRAEPEVLSGREFAEPVEQADVGELPDGEGDQAPKNDAGGRTENAGERLVRHG